MSGLRQRSLEPVLRRSGLLIAMYGTAAVIALWMSRTLPDFDYGFHLRTGQWIVAHGSVPDAEVFSANAVSPRWVAYSWAYEVLLCALAAAFGVWAPVVLSVAMSLLIAHMIFKMVRRTSGHTALAAGLTLIGILAMASMLYGRSVMFTIVFAALELHLLLRATVLEDRRALLLVPLVFAVWANVHIQFIYGFFLYGCFLAQAWLDVLRGSPDADTAARAHSLATRMTWIGAACLLATLANPYHVRIYDPVVRYLFQAPTIYRYLQEFGPPGLASIPTRATLALALLVLLGSGRRLLGRPFLLLMFAVALGLAFRAGRDAWLVVVTGGAVAATALRRPQPEALRANRFVVATGTACVIAVAVLAMDISADTLRANLRRRFPVDAADFIESRNLPGPMYNDFNWGGYLMWRLPQHRVAMDGRTHVYSTESILRSVRVWNAEPGWNHDPELAAAGFVVASREMPLTRSLKKDPRFHLAYEDAVSAIFVRDGS
jgi:hypothetical protein